MKKMRRVLALLSLVCLLIPVLCGCSMVEKMRESQAFYDGDGNILWNGAVYKRLSQGEGFAPEIDYQKTVYVTEKDVPVLLEAIFAEEILNATEDGLILEYNSGYSIFGTGAYYCREDRFEEIESRIRNGFVPEVVCYSYDVYDPEEMEFVNRVYQLNQKQLETLQRIVATVEPSVVGDGWYLAEDWCVYLKECTKDMLFQRERMELLVSENTYYLRLNTEQGSQIYQVPEADEKIAAEIMKQYISDMESDVEFDIEFEAEGEEYI